MYLVNVMRVIYYHAPHEYRRNDNLTRSSSTNFENLQKLLSQCRLRIYNMFIRITVLILVHIYIRGVIMKG